MRKLGDTKVYDWERPVPGENEMIEQNKGLVTYVINCRMRHLVKHLDPDDVFQVGCIGLLQAVRKFDAKRGIKLSTYAVPFIQGLIGKYVRDLNCTKRGGGYVTVSLQEPLSSRGETVITLEDHIASSYAEGTFAAVNNALVKDKQLAFIDTLILVSNLSCTEQEVIQFRLEGYNQVQMAKIRGCAQITMSRAERAAIEKIRNFIHIAVKQFGYIHGEHIAPSANTCRVSCYGEGSWY
jgi:RNA polymerase sporulation-specific sigma factor